MIRHHLDRQALNPPLRLFLNTYAELKEDTGKFALYVTCIISRPYPKFIRC